MDNLSMAAESQQYQQYYHQYQQPQLESAASHAYDPSTQAYCAPYQHYNQAPHHQQEAQHDYSYYYPDYSNSYQSQPQVEPSSIHPPGVPVPAETPQTHVQNHPNVYYGQGLANPQQQPLNGYMAPGHSAFAARGSHGGRAIRGGRRGGRHGSSRGRGRGRGGARGTASANLAATRIPTQVSQPPSSGPGKAAAPPPRMAWCELCRVDCNSPEILEQHKNGKKHKRNLKVYEELQNLNKVSDLKLEADQPEKKEGGSEEKRPMISEAVSDKPESSEEHGGGARGGLKRKMRGGRGRKLMRTNDGSRKPVEPPKPKQLAPLFCELCNVKCESQVVFDSHMAGKKHVANLKRYQGHQAALGGGVQALYPPIPNVPSMLFITPADQQRIPEAHVLASSLVNQQGSVQDPQASQAALIQLLSQHGINDAQTLLAQLIPFLLTQVLPNGAAPGALAQSGAPASGSAGIITGQVVQDQPNSLTQVAQLSTGDNHHSETAVDLSVSTGAVDKSNMGSLELQDKVAEPSIINIRPSTEQADMAGEKPLIPGSDNTCEGDTKESVKVRMK